MVCLATVARIQPRSTLPKPTLRNCKHDTVLRLTSVCPCSNKSLCIRQGLNFSPLIPSTSPFGSAHQYARKLQIVLQGRERAKSIFFIDCCTKRKRKGQPESLPGQSMVRLSKKRMILVSESALPSSITTDRRVRGKTTKAQEGKFEEACRACTPVAGRSWSK